jgi:tryptophan halogenase
MKKIIIIGGGASGWLTALALNKFYKDSNITLIESSKIGILGAGEGSTPNFGHFLSMLGINHLDFFNETNSTVKNGLHMQNWTGDNSNLYHMFTGKPPNITDKIKKFGYHFDAKLVSEFLKKIALERGINWIDDEVSKINNLNENITNIELKGGDVIDLDLIFDCSGFARLTSKAINNQEWESYSEYLLVNKAFGFFLPQKNKYTINDNTKTKVIAMNCGWMFNIPLQHRCGCGYVFNDKYCTIEEAKKEVEDYFGHEIDVRKIFDFNPGTFKRSWVGNTISIGLSYSFIEPLEATSLMTTIMQLKKLIEIDFNEKYKENYNTFCYETNEQNSIFIRYHYLNEKLDTPFWKDAYNMPIQPKLKKILDDNNYPIPTNDVELFEMMELKELTLPHMVFFVNNYRTIYHKNKKILKKQII